MKPLIILSEADAEGASAADWYEHQAGMGDNFLEAVSTTIHDLRIDPSSHERIRGNVRRRRVSEFPYDVIFEEREQQIVVIAIAHHHRRANYWRGRRYSE